MKDRTILDLCGGTGAWSQPYREARYRVELVDLNCNGDVRLLHKPKFKVYGVLAAPPCTHLAGSGARWWKEKGDEALLEALSVVDACLRVVMITKPKFWALENPVGRLVKFLGKPKMYFDPCDYGDPYTKKTAVWGDFNIPQKSPVEVLIQDTPKGHHNQDLYLQEQGIQLKHGNRGVLRSITPLGFARAFFKANR